MSKSKRYDPPSSPPPSSPDKKQESNQPLNLQAMIACDYIQRAKEEAQRLNAQREKEIEELKKMIEQGRQLLGDGA